MGLFDKKYCDICGRKIGLLGNRKLSDGNICNDCANKLSPYFRGLKSANLQSIQAQLAYREQNRQNLNFFNPSRTFGMGTKVYIDYTQNKFVVSRNSDYKSANADIIDLSQVLNVTSDVKEHRSEIYTKDANGNRTSYNPPRYEYKYEITVTITVNSPYFNEIKFEITDTRPNNKMSEEFNRYAQTADEIVTALGGNTRISANTGYAQQNIGYSQQGNSYGQTNNGYSTPQQNNIYGQTNNGYSNSQQSNIYGQTNSGYSTPQQNNVYGQVNNGYSNSQQSNIYGQTNNGYSTPQQNNIYGQSNNDYLNTQQGNNNTYGQFNNGIGNINQQNQFNQQSFGQQQYNQQNYVNQPYQQSFQNVQWVCRNCGTSNTSNFCQNCGTLRS